MAIPVRAVGKDQGDLVRAEDAGSDGRSSDATRRTHCHGGGISRGYWGLSSRRSTPALSSAPNPAGPWESPVPDQEVGGLTGIPRARKGGCDGSYVVWEGTRVGGVAPAGHRHETQRVKSCRETTSGEGREAAERATERTPRPDKSEGGRSGWHRQMTPVVGDGQSKEGEASRVSAVPVDAPKRRPRRPIWDGKRACDSRAQRAVRTVDRAAPR